MEVQSKLINNHQLYSYRTKQIIRLLEDRKCLSTEQIHLLVFKKVSKEMCYRTLRGLVKTKKIRKNKRSIEQPSAFYIDDVGQPFHTIGVNWIWIWFEKWKRYQAGDTIETFQTEATQYLPYLRPDAFVTIKNNIKKCKIFYFVEFDVCESGNTFDKVKKYNDLYEAIKAKKVFYPWLKETDGFPQTVIVTTGSLDRIKRIIERENRNGLSFEVWSLDDIKKQCLKEI